MRIRKVSCRMVFLLSAVIVCLFAFCMPACAQGYYEYSVNDDGMTATLRGYRLTGLIWLGALREAGFGGMLADDMGLGKTI